MKLTKWELESDPTYCRTEINKNPIWRRAFELSEKHNDSAPIGWGKYIKQAEAERPPLLRNASAKRIRPLGIIKPKS